MYFKSLSVFALMLVVAVQANYKPEFTKVAKDCMTEMKVDETAVRTWFTDDYVIKDDDTTEKFFECCMRTHITDTNEVVIDDKFTEYMTDVFTNRLEGRHNLAKVLVPKCVDHCKTVKDVTRGKTAVKVMNCFMTTLHDYIKKE